MILKSRFFRSFRLPFQNEKGFSISENLLAMVILAVNFLALGTISSTLTQSFRQIDSATENMDLSSRIRQALSNRTRCELNLVTGISPKLTVSVSPFTSASVQKIEQFDSLSNATRLVASTSGADADFKPTTMLIQPLVSIPSSTAGHTQIIADLLISLDTSTTRIPLLLEMSGNEIVSCMSNQDSEMSLKEKQCSIRSEGQFTFVPETGACEDRRVRRKVMADNPYSGSCPSGFTIDPVDPWNDHNSWEWNGCYGENYNNGNYVPYSTYDPSQLASCPVPVIATAFGDGGTKYSCPGFKEIDPSSPVGECRWTYSTSVTDASHLRTEIRCVQVSAL